jgi:hypothetical protein
MAQAGALNILVVCPWVAKLPPISAHIVRVDFAAALRAALVVHRFDAAFYIDTPSLARDVADACLREHAPRLALTVIDRLDEIASELAKQRS